MVEGQSSGRLLPAERAKIGKQIVLPWRKSVEICLGGIKTRLGRSAVTLLGIVLAIAFLMSVLTNQAITKNLIDLRDDHVNHLLQRSAGIDVADPASLARKDQQGMWLMGLSMLVCLVGIVNSMLMSVTERFREIGTMKCLGALDTFIVRLFFIESIIQGAVGTVIGIPVGFLMTYLRMGITFGFGTFEYGYLFGRTVMNLVVCLTVGTLLAVLAAIYPAYVAARMQPVEAMRVEE